MRTQSSFPQTYRTEFKQAEVEECSEKFKKDCFIKYKDVASSRTVKVCNEEVRRDCEDRSGPVVCDTEYETVCETKYKTYEVDEDVVNCEVVKEEQCMGEGGEKMCFNVPKQKCEKTTAKSGKVSSIRGMVL